MKKVKNYLLAFLIPFFIFVLASILTNHIPFGKMLFNVYDSYTMYPPLLVGSVKSFFNGEFFYSLKAGLGTDFYNIKTLYMNSPLNLLLILFGYEHVYEFMTFLIYLRIGLLGITMNIFLNSISKDNKYSFKQLLFSSIYALTTYSVASQIHIMWMDSVILLPIVILGLDKLILNKDSKLYIIFLTLTIFINFYIGYMVCIFSVIYFVYKCYLTNNFKKETIKKFLISSLLSGCMCMIIIIPQIFSLLEGRGNDFAVKELFGIGKYSLMTLVYNSFPGSYMAVDNFLDGGALIYVSLFVLSLVILYFFNTKIPRKDKKATLLMVILFTLSCFVNFIDYAWNMFQEPVWWSHRYIFVFCFFLIMIAYQNYEKINGIKITRKQRLLVEIIFIVLSITSFILKTTGLYLQDYYVLYLTIGLILFVIYLNYFTNPKANKILIILLIIEIFINTYNTLIINSSYTYQESRERTQNKKIYDELKEYDNDFYRVINSRYVSNESFMYEYYSTSVFSSSYNNLPRVFLNNVGVFNGKTNKIDFTFNNPAISSLLGVKYFVGNKYNKEIFDDVYYNDDSLSIGYVVPKSINDISFESDDTFKNINALYEGLLEEDISLFEDIDYEDSIILNNLYYKNDEIMVKELSNDSNAYKIFYEFISSIDGILVPNDCGLYKLTTIKVNDEVYDNTTNPKLIEVKKGDIVEVTILFSINEPKNMKKLNKETIGYHILNVDKFNEAIDKIKNNPKLENINTNKCVLSGDITLDSDKKLMITIPYLEGFNVYVDGKKVEYHKILDTFIGIDLESGEHNIKITYIPKGFISGSIISCISLLIAIISFKKKKC